MHIGHHSGHGHAAELLQNLDTRLQNSPVPPEFVDNGALDPCPLLFLQQGHGAVELGKHAPPVDVPHQKDRGIHQLGKAHVYNILLLQVDFRGAARPFDDDDVVFRGQGTVAFQHLGQKLPLPAVIFHGPHISHSHAVHDHLAAHVGGGL